MTLPRQEPGVSYRLHAISLHEPFGLPLHHQTGVWCFMRLNKICREVIGEMEKILKGVLTIKQEYKKNRMKSIERAGAAENK